MVNVCVAGPLAAHVHVVAGIGEVRDTYLIVVLGSPQDVGRVHRIYTPSPLCTTEYVTICIIQEFMLTNEVCVSVLGFTHPHLPLEQCNPCYRCRQICGVLGGGVI